MIVTCLSILAVCLSGETQCCVWVVKCCCSDLSRQRRHKGVRLATLQRVALWWHVSNRLATITVQTRDRAWSLQNKDRLVSELLSVRRAALQCTSIIYTADPRSVAQTNIHFPYCWVNICLSASFTYYSPRHKAKLIEWGIHRRGRYLNGTESEAYWSLSGSLLLFFFIT